MIRRPAFVFSLFIVSITGNLFSAAPPLQEWQHCYGGSAQDIPSKIVKLQDGSIFLLANVDSYDGDITGNHGSTDIWLTKLDSSGGILWQRTYGGTSIDVGTGLCEGANGNLIVSGYTASSDGDIPGSNGNFDALLFSVDKSGNINWLKVYGGSQVDLCYSQIQTNDGGILIGGGSYSNNGDVSSNHGDQDFWIMKTDSNGNLLWSKSAGGSGIDVCYALAEDSSGNIFACGTTNSTDHDVTFNHGNYEMWVLKYDASGNVIWNKTYGGSDYETAQTILIDSHQNILLGGYTRSNDGDVVSNFGFGDCWLVEINGNGNLITEKTLGGTGGDNLYSILETLDGGYLFTSGTSSSDRDVRNALGMEDIWMYKTDNLFHAEWTHNYGGSGNERPVCTIQNKDGGFLVAGYTFSNNIDVSGSHGSADIWLIDLSCKVPTAFFSTPASACLGDTMNITNGSINSSEVKWFINGSLFSDGNSAQINFTSSGNYQVSLFVQTCFYSSTKVNDISVNDCNLPQVHFSSQVNTICANSQVLFTDASVNAVSWHWTFQGGTPATSSIQDPVVSYAQPGVYNVILTVTNSYGSQTILRQNYITVNAPPPVPVITANGNELQSTPAYSYQWFYNNAPVPTATSQNLMAFIEGYYQVLVQDANQCISQSAVFNFSVTGINENNPDLDFSVFPNPASDEISIQLPEKASGSIRIMNIHGQKLIEKTVVKNGERFSINLSEFSGGIYMVVFTNDSGKSSQKYIVKH